MYLHEQVVRKDVLVDQLGPVEPATFPCSTWNYQDAKIENEDCEASVRARNSQVLLSRQHVFQVSIL